MARWSEARIAQARREAVSAARRRLPWMMLTALALGLSGARASHAQFRGADWSVPPVGGVPIVLAEGEGVLFLPLATSVAGLAVFDIVTAAKSAKSMNAQKEGDFRSPGTAFGASLAATVVPVAIGVAGYTDNPGILIAGGIVLGPSVGHMYAGRPMRGLLTAALRAGLGFAALLEAFSAD